MVFLKLKSRSSARVKMTPAIILLLLIATALAFYRSPMAAADPSRSLHDVHVKDQGLNCKDCHVQLASPKKDACQECHEAADVEKLYSAFVIDVNRSGAPKPADHTQDFRRAHGVSAEEDPGSCAVCHEQRFCQDCHEGVNLQGSIHPLNFRQTHAFEADGHEQDCLVCHETREFCVNCHQQNMVLTHPLGAGWANQEGGDHTSEAEADLESCLDCHDLGNADPVCLRPGCHTAGGNSE